MGMLGSGCKSLFFPSSLGIVGNNIETTLSYSGTNGGTDLPACCLCGCSFSDALGKGVTVMPLLAAKSRRIRAYSWQRGRGYSASKAVENCCDDSAMIHQIPKVSAHAFHRTGGTKREKQDG